MHANTPIVMLMRVRESHAAAICNQTETRTTTKWIESFGGPVYAVGKMDNWPAGRIVPEQLGGRMCTLKLHITLVRC